MEHTHGQTIKNGLDWTNFVSLDWEPHYPELYHKRLSHLCSDRFPILLDCGGIRGGRRYFKSENVWLKTEGFVERVGNGGPPIRLKALQVSLLQIS